VAYKITYHEESGIVFLHFHGTASLAEHKQSRKEAIELCRSVGTQKWLVNLGDLNAHLDMTKEELLDFASSWHFPQINEIFTAVILPQNRDSQDDFSFIVHLSKLSGFSMQTFYTEKEGIGWLNSSSK
jgi:hypothetical protein